MSQIISLDFIKEKYHRHKQIGWTVSWNLIARGYVILVNLITGIVLARDIGESDRGVWQLFISSLFIFNILLSFGISYSAVYYANKDRDRLKKYIDISMILSIGGSIVVGIVLIFFSNLIRFQSEMIRNVFVICYIVYSASLVYRGCLVGIHQNSSVVKLDIILRTAYGLFILIFHLAGKLTLLSAVLYLTVDYLVFSWIAYRQLGVKLFPIHFDTKLFRDTFSFNSKTYLAILTSALLVRVDQYILKAMMGNYYVGVYGIGATIVENLGILSAVMMNIYMPKFIEIDDYNLLIAKSKKVFSFVLFSSVGVAIIFYFLSPWVIELYFKKPHPEGAKSLQILLIGYVFWSMYVISYSVYISIRFKKSIILCLIVLLGLNITLNYIFIPKYGIIASAWASTLCYILLFVFSYFDLFVLKRNNYNKREASYG